MAGHSHSDWFVRKGGKEFGPLTSSQLRKSAQKGDLSPDCLVRKGTSGGWVPASRVKGLFDAPEVPHHAAEAPIPHATGPSTNVADLLDEAESQPRHGERLEDVGDTQDEEEPVASFGTERFLGEIKGKKGAKAKREPRFSMELFGVTINDRTLLGCGFVVASILVAVAAIAFAVYWPVPAQSLLDARAVACNKVMPNAVLIRDDADGDTLLVRVEFSKEFLRANATKSDDNYYLNANDFRLVHDGGESRPICFLGWTGTQGKLKVPVGLGDPKYIDAQLPAIGRAVIETTGELSYERSGTGRETVQGSLTVKVSGVIHGNLTVNPIVQPTVGPRAQSSGFGGFSLNGKIEGQLPDQTPIQFDYASPDCVISWTGDRQGYSAGRSQWEISLVDAWRDKTVKSHLMFSRPSTTSRLALQYRDGPPLELSPSLGLPTAK